MPPWTFKTKVQLPQATRQSYINLKLDPFMRFFVLSQVCTKLNFAYKFYFFRHFLPKWQHDNDLFNVCVKPFPVWLEKYILSFVSPNLTFILLRKMVMIGHFNMVFFPPWSVRIVCLILLFVDLVISRSQVGA